MTDSKKWQIAIVLILTCNFVLRAAEEPNDPNDSQIKIEISDQQRPWERTSPARFIRGKPVYDQEASTVPTHVAEGYVRIKYAPSLKAESFLKTSAGAAMTTEQREFIKSTNDRAFIQTRAKGGPQLFNLYAVSEADAMRMIEAFIEILNERPGQIRLEYGNRLQKYQGEMAKAKGLLPGKEALLASAKADYDKSKESAHPFEADTRAAERARQTMLEMSKMLDALDVELAGIREKLKVIQEYWSQDGTWTKEAFAKLQEMQIIQTIELKGAEARRKAAVAIRKREQDFLDLFNQWLSLDSEVEQLKGMIKSREGKIAQIEERFVDPRIDPGMQDAKIHEDKVVIYPVYHVQMN